MLKPALTLYTQATLTEAMGPGTVCNRRVAVLLSLMISYTYLLDIAKK